MENVEVHPEPFPIGKDAKCFYDCELYGNVFFVVCKTEGRYCLFSEETKSDALRKLWEKAIMIGFNSSSYDSRMVGAFLKGASMKELRILNDEIISRQSSEQVGQGGGGRQKNNHYDAKIGCGKKDRSLKEWQLLLGMSVEESPVPFDAYISRDNSKEAVKYCIHDVDATEMLFNKKCVDNFNAIRILCEMAEQNANYGKTIGSVTVDLLCHLAGMDRKALGCRERFDYGDMLERLDRSGYLDMERVKEVMGSVAEYEDAGIPEVKRAYLGHIPVKGMSIEIGAGGAHWRSPRKLWEECDDSDVASMYPNIMLAYGIIDRTLGAKGNAAFREMIATRMASKKKNPELASALKIAINSVYGKMSGEGGLNDHSGRLAVCVIGQLAICDLVARYMEHVPECEIAQINTDGVIYKFDRKKHKAVADEQMREWSDIFEMDLETTRIKFLYQHNINNYVAETEDGGKTEYKYKGSFFKSSNGTKDYIYKSLIHFALHGEKPDIREFPNTDFIDLVKSRKISGADAKQEILVNGKAVPNKLVPFVKTVKGVPIALRNPADGKVSGKVSVAASARDDVDDSFEEDLGVTGERSELGPKTLPTSCAVVFRKDDAFGIKPDYESLDRDVDEAIETLRSPMKDPRKMHWKEALRKEKIKNWTKANGKSIREGMMPPGYNNPDKFITDLESAGLSKSQIKEWHKKHLMRSVDNGDIC